MKKTRRNSAGVFEGASTLNIIRRAVQDNQKLASTLKELVGHLSECLDGIESTPVVPVGGVVVSSLYLPSIRMNISLELSKDGLVVSVDGNELSLDPSNPDEVCAAIKERIQDILKREEIVHEIYRLSSFLDARISSSYLMDSPGMTSNRISLIKDRYGFFEVYVKVKCPPAIVIKSKKGAILKIFKDILNKIEAPYEERPSGIFVNSCIQDVSDTDTLRKFVHGLLKRLTDLEKAVIFLKRQQSSW